jgi:excisionase family DNA binding protein
MLLVPGGCRRTARRGRLVTVSEIAQARVWLTVPDLAEQLGVTQSRVRKLIEDGALLAVRREGAVVVPSDFLRDGEPLHELRGTVMVLHDSGFSSEEAMTWLLESEESLGTAPIDALRAGRKAEVRRVAQALGF